jgi:hypothetical protein
MLTIHTQLVPTLNEQKQYEQKNKTHNKENKMFKVLEIYLYFPVSLHCVVLN